MILTKNINDSYTTRFLLSSISEALKYGTEVRRFEPVNLY